MMLHRSICLRTLVKLNDIGQTIDRALEAAGLHRSNAKFTGIRATIDKAFAAAGLNRRAEPHAPSRGPAFETRSPGSADADQGQFITLSHSSEYGTRAYKLYVPSSHDGSSPMPLLVMLHGCKQDPDDFAAGTRMNELAERHGFLVAYPAQTALANGSNCWNWFQRAEQTRSGAEPSLIAGIVGEITDAYAVDERKVFAAGLSAGAAMAVILGRAYPDVFAAVAAHSGLPSGAAHDVPSAFAAMQGKPGGQMRPPGQIHTAMPTIVFHGDADATVTAANGAAIVGQAVSAYDQAGTALQRLTRLDAMAGGKQCTTTQFMDDQGATLVEEWVVHGGSHAWFGGSSAGSYTDHAGPDASSEIVRFFLDR